MVAVTLAYGDIISVVTGAATAVREELINVGCGDVNRFCPIVPGELAWDECDCGLFAQTITQSFPSNNFPTPASDSRQDTCGPKFFVINVNAYIIRCVPGPSDNGTSPSCVVLEDAAIQLECDRQALRSGITCYLRDLRNSYRIFDYSVGATTVVGPQGGCAGVEISYQFAVTGICC